jgi:tRNA-Thr(GGU) m(6)t(6)A37 methyltransferase TsaA
MSNSGFTVAPIAFVRSPRTQPTDDFWGDVVAEIELCPDMPTESLDGLDEYSHAEIIFYFHRVAQEKIVRGSRHPRDNPAYPRVGILAHRAKDRPNRLGSTIVRILGREGRTLRVLALDAIDGTPVLDIKPVMTEFLPREPVQQPAWTHEKMANYWLAASAADKQHEQ